MVSTDPMSLFLCLLFFVLTFWIDSTNGQCANVDIRLYQDSNQLATVLPVSTAQTVEEFYGYNGGSFTGSTILPLAGDTSLITIHQDSNTCELSLVIVHSKPWEGPWFSAARMYINGELWNPRVRDDPTYTDKVFHDDNYDTLYQRKPGFNSVEWFWYYWETDGLAETFVPDWSGCLIVEPIFDVVLTNPNVGISYPPLSNWKFVTSGGSTINLDRDAPLRICLPGGDPSNPGFDPFPRSNTEGTCAQLGSIETPICGRCERPAICAQHWFCNIARKLICNFGQNYTLYHPFGPESLEAVPPNPDYP